MHHVCVLQVETPVAPAPLQQALTEADHLAYLATEQAAREAQAAAAEAAERAAREAQAAAEAAAAEAAEAAARAEQLERVRLRYICSLLCSVDTAHHAA
jgi:hypothetical protein